MLLENIVKTEEGYFLKGFEYEGSFDPLTHLNGITFCNPLEEVYTFFKDYAVTNPVVSDTIMSWAYTEAKGWCMILHCDEEFPEPYISTRGIVMTVKGIPGTPIPRWIRKEAEREYHRFVKAQGNAVLVQSLLADIKAIS